MGKRYVSVSQVVKDFIDDESFRERFEKEINDKQAAKTLFAIRSRAGKTQDEMAERLECSPNRLRILSYGSTKTQEHVCAPVMVSGPKSRI